MPNPTLLDRGASDSRPVSRPSTGRRVEASADARRRVGHFRIEEKLGEGGVGTVYLGFDELLERRVALKALRPEVADDAAVRKRFLREARLLSQLHHPNLCQVHDLIEEGDERWLVLEYIEGQTLAETMDGVEFETKLEIATGVAEAIAVAHRERIVHRDLKPENIMLPVEGGVKVLDFGLARSAGDEQSGPRWAGTLLYMSPEQASRGDVWEASDLFSFGLVLQELFTGRPAYPTLPFDELFPRVSRGETLPPVDLDPELTELIGRLLAFEPDSRPSAGETVEALRALRQRPTRLRRRRLTIAVAALLTVVVLGALVSALVARRQAARQAQLAQQFTREADDIEWLLRSAYLGPPQDLRPLRRQVRDRMDALRERMEQVGDVGRGPGEYALGRAAVALGDYRRAWGHLDMAWRRGYQPPEVASALGLAGLEVYRMEARQLRAVRDSERRQRLREELETRWLKPALAHIERGREALRQRAASGVPVRSKAESGEYVDAVAAFDSGDLDAALGHARAVLEREPGLYEAEMVAGRVHHSRAEDHSSRGEIEQARSAYGLARQAFRRAAELGRSDPAVHLEACALELAQIAFNIYDANDTIELQLESGEVACQLARRLDEDNPQPWRLLSELRMRRAEVSLSKEQSLASATRMAQEAIRRQPENADAWRSLGHVYSVQADAKLALFQDAGEALELMTAAYGEAYRLAPRVASMSNALGNGHSMRALSLFEHGIDGRADSEQAEAAYLRAIELDPGSGLSNLALNYSERAAFEFAQGLDARESIRRGLEAWERDFEASRQHIRGLVGRAELDLLMAWDAARRGELKSEALARAREGCQQAFEIQPDSSLVRRRCRKFFLTLSEMDLFCGNEASGLELAVVFFEENYNENSLIELSQTVYHRLSGAREMVAGRSPELELNRAREALRRALEFDPQLVHAKLEGGRIALLAAVWRLRSGWSASVELDRAQAAFEAVVGLRPERFEGDVGRIQVALVRGALAGDVASLSEANQLLEALRERGPGLTEIVGLRQRGGVDLALTPYPCPKL